MGTNTAEGAAEGPPVVFAHLGYGLDARQYRERFLSGYEPDETPYGFHVAERLGVRVVFSHDHPESAFFRLVRRVIKRILGFDVIHLWRNRRAIERAQVVWTMQESEWLSLRFVGLFIQSLRKPVIGNTVWLFDRWESINPLMRRLYARLAQGDGVLTVHSNQYLPLMKRFMPEVRIERMYFGTSTESHPMLSPTTDRATPMRVLAVGNDPTRDWQTLLEAIGNDPGFEIELVCSWYGSDVRARYRSIRYRNISVAHHLATFQALYRWADVVVIPMHPNRFSGITVALEAIANGKPVVASRTGGVPTYFGEDAVAYVSPHDPIAFRDALFETQRDGNSRVEAAQATFRANDYSLTGLMGRYVALSRPWLNPGSPVSDHDCHSKGIGTDHG